MKPLLKDMLQKMSHNNSSKMAMEVFGLSDQKHYDVLVVAPGWKPTKIMAEYPAEVTVTAKHSYVSGYEVTIGDKHIGWIQTSAGACNIIDNLIICAELDFDKLVFVGAVGGLKKDFDVGDVCTPLYSVEGAMAPAYLLPDITDYKPFEKVEPANSGFIDRVVDSAGKIGIPIKKASVYCTDSIACEYYHLDFIRAFNTDLIEMETSVFYRLAAMIEKPAIALLVVSDNSVNGEPLIGKSEQQKSFYDRGRKEYVPKLIEVIARMDIK